MARQYRIRCTLCVFLLFDVSFSCSVPMIIAAAQSKGTPRAPTLSFQPITINDGLSQGMVNAIYQDRKGFMWFGTKAGLNRYDGYRFTIFRNSPFDSTSLSNDYITTICEDRRGRLWIGTSNGLNCFDPATEKFRRFLHDHANPHSLNDNNISAICEAPAQPNAAEGVTVLWIGTVSGGLNKLVLYETRGELPPAMRAQHSNQKQQPDYDVVGYQHHPDDTTSISSNRIWDLLVDQTGVLWIGTDQGLCRLDPPHLSAANEQPVTFTRYRHDKKKASSLLDNDCHSLYESRDSSIWIGTTKGLARIIPARGSPGVFENHPYPVKLLTPALPEAISDICEDRRGILWLATYQGLLLFDPKKASYKLIRHDSEDPASLSHDGICSIFGERSGAIWVGTFGFGLNRWDPLALPFQCYTPRKLALDSDTELSIYALLEDRRGVTWIFTGHDWHQLNRKTGSVLRHPLNFASEQVRALFEDHAGYLWITNNAGASRYNARSRRIEKIFPPPEAPKLKLNAIYEDNHGDMWFGVVNALPNGPNALAIPQIALYCWSRKTEKITHYSFTIPANLTDDWLDVRRIVQDQKGMFWLATNVGLLRFHPQSGALKIFRNESKHRASLTNNEVKTLLPDPVEPGRFLWLGTNGGGLNRLDLAAENFSHYLEEQGLSNNVVYGILSDNAGNLWMSTNKGLSQAILARESRDIIKFRNYDIGDGLQSNEFNTGAYSKNAQGEMFFGGIKGFNIFHPDSIKDNAYLPPVVFTDFYIRYQSVKPGALGSPLQKTISLTDTVTLSPKDNVMAIEFAALNYSAPKKNLYSYKLENFDENWSQPGRGRRATYTNLKPGVYVLRVRGSNSSGEWNEDGARLTIAIKPYFYQTTWFIVLGTLLMAVVFYGGLRWRLHHLEITHRELENQVAARTTQLRESEAKLHQINERLEQRVLERTAALHQSEERYRVLYDYSPIMYFTVDARGVVLSVNQSGCEELGYSAEELIGRPVLNVFHEKDKEEVKRQLAACLQKPQLLHAWELRKLRKDGSILWVSESARAVKNREGDWVILIVCEDITARKQVEIAIKESQNRYYVLFDEAPTPLWEIDVSAVKIRLEAWRKKGIDNLRAFLDEHPEAVEQCLAQIKTLNVNQATWRLYQADSEEHLIFNTGKIWNAESLNAFKEQLIAVAHGKTDNKFETSMRTLRGEKIHIWAHWRVVPGCEQSLARVFMAVIDITANQQTLDELHVSRERLRALSAHLHSLREQERLAIARDLHDELGQALTSLKMDISMLKSKVQSTADQYRSETVLDDIETMHRLIADTINKVRILITELRPEVLDTLGLIPALEWQIEEFHKRTNLACAFSSTVEEELYLVKEHAIAVFRIFQESLTNIARHAQAGKVTATIEKYHGALWVEITDDGKGITAEDLNAHGKFGLLGMRERALVFGGEVTITGAPGRGTTVKIKVPIAAA